jgi:ribosomal protein L25 (general stress protein Ctc)
MEKKLILNAKTRAKDENAKHLRKENLIPSVVY